MSRRSDSLLLKDMLAALQKIRRHTKGMNYQDSRKDEKTVDVVCRNFEILGEAAGRLSRAFRLRHGQIDWRAIIGSGNRIIHAYFGVDRALLWNHHPERCSDRANRFTEGIG